MYNIFGFQILTKEERRKKDAEFAEMIFPGGEAQKAKVSEALHEAFPKLDRQMLLYLFITVRENMCRDGAAFPEAWKRSMKKMPFSLSEEEREKFRVIMEEMQSGKESF